MKTLRALIERQPAYADSYLLLGETYEKQGRKEEAGAIYRKALGTDGIPNRDKSRIAAQMEAMKQEKTDCETEMKREAALGNRAGGVTTSSAI